MSLCDKAQRLAREDAHRDRSAGKRHGVKPGQRLDTLFGLGQQL
jgi:hypothetical protein